MAGIAAALPGHAGGVHFAVLISAYTAFNNLLPFGSAFGMSTTTVRCAVVLFIGKDADLCKAKNNTTVLFCDMVEFSRRPESLSFPVCSTYKTKEDK